MVQEDFFKMLKMVAPGTELREGLNNILRARTGGLIVVGDRPEILELAEGGFELNVPFRAAALYELAKMDGAIILSEDVKRIVMANAHLTPPSAISSRETGIRHRVAERMARYTGSMVIAISERRSLITIYQGANRHVVGEIGFILTKANQAIQTLDKYKILLKRYLDNLTLLELEDVVKVSDVARAVSQFEMVTRIIKEVNIYVSQLGSEGKLIEMQKDELTIGIEEEGTYLLRDYLQNRGLESVKKELGQKDTEDILELQTICRIMGFGADPGNLERQVTPRGFRVLSKLPKIPAAVVENAVQSFKLLPAVLGAGTDELNAVEGIGEIRANAIQQGLKKLKEEVLLG